MKNKIKQNFFSDKKLNYLLKCLFIQFFSVIIQFDKFKDRCFLRNTYS